MKSPAKTYLLTGVGLLALLALTIGLAFVDLGALNTPVALLISLAKGVLIVWIFMHLRGTTPLARVALFAGFFWLGIMMLLSMSDFLTRGWK